MPRLKVREGSGQKEVKKRQHACMVSEMSSGHPRPAQSISSFCSKTLNGNMKKNNLVFLEPATHFYSIDLFAEVPYFYDVNSSGQEKHCTWDLSAFPLFRLSSSEKTFSKYSVPRTHIHPCAKNSLPSPPPHTRTRFQTFKNIFECSEETRKWLIFVVSFRIGWQVQTWPGRR